jgi:hypothetical protein
MQHVANALLQTIDDALPLLQSITNDTASVKPAPNKWSYKEIIGHLIDSAGNNQQKFVRCMMQDGVDFVIYQQDEWVATQQYNKADWNELLLQWFHCNRHIAHIIRYADTTLHHNKVYISGKGPFTLGFIMPDYVEHLKHHLKAILPNATFLQNSFQQVY